MHKFRNKYRIPSAWLQNWDYGWNASYFVTICTANRECYFGNIMDGKMKLSEIGTMANKYWMEIPEHFPFVKLGVHVVMPNHVHGIIIIDKWNSGQNDEKNAGGNVETPNLGVSTPQSAHPPQSPKQSQTAAASKKWKPGTLGAILNQYKRICTIESRRIHAGFAWQSRFHDHIIRNDAEYQRIENYIVNNPENWDGDKFYTL